MQSTWLKVGAFMVFLVVAFFALNAYIYSEKQETDDARNTAFEPYRGTLSGEFVCLPHVDQSGPQTEECAFGVKTDAGEYYAVDFNLMSQGHPEVSAGQRFSAMGLITPIERISTNHWQKYPVIGIFSITDSVAITEETYVCQMDAKICPDGSSVGRTGPRCEFAECPSPQNTKANVTTFLGGTATGLSVSVSPKVIVSDSRCPADVTCVWAGTVAVKTLLTTAVGHGEHTLTLGQAQPFGDYTVTLTAVAPEKTSASIAESAYRFTFSIEKVR